MNEILISIQQALPTLSVIFIGVFSFIVLLRIILAFLLERAYKRYQKLKRASKKLLPKKKKDYIKEEDELLRSNIEVPRAHSAMKAERRSQRQKAQESANYELIESEEQSLAKAEMNQVKIVDFVKPVGFWTSLILGQKLTYLVQSAQTLNERGDQGFWASMIEAKEREAGRQHARGR